MCQTHLNKVSKHFNLHLFTLPYYSNHHGYITVTIQVLQNSLYCLVPGREAGRRQQEAGAGLQSGTPLGLRVFWRGQCAFLSALKMHTNTIFIFQKSLKKVKQIDLN